MDNMSLYLKNKTLNGSLEDVYVGLLSDNVEVSKASYKRLPAPFSISEEGQTSNSQELIFPIAGEKWGDITEVAIYEDETGGEWLYKSTPEFVKNISTSGQYRIPANYLIVRIR